MKLDYKKLGLKCGLEVHQQLKTKHKLFCNCSAAFSETEPSGTIIRKLRAVAGELGEVDIAAFHEVLKEKEFHYKIYPNEVCEVEEDEEPPHPLNQEALGMALEIALLFNCEIPEEIHVMRKTVVDGSAISGFQRTVIVGLNGKINVNSAKIGITNLCLEEDAAQILAREANKITYGLDRLGIPLVEIGTTADISTPEQAKEVAEKLGMILRSTGKAKRGIGTIRQDINVSIKNGARIEIKGAQELNLIPQLIKNEILRQLNLLKIKLELQKRKFKKIKPGIKEVTKIFVHAESKITQNKKIFAIKIPNFAGFLKYNLTETKTLGKELAEYIKATTGIKGIIHSDENLQAYNLDKEFEVLGKELKCKSNDTLIIVGAEENLARKSLQACMDRINQLLISVPKEARKALVDGDTEYMRPLPGAARMYPETDLPAIKIEPKLINKIKKSLPETWEEKIKRFVKKYRINQEIAKQIVYSDLAEKFERLAKEFNTKIVATTLTSTLKELKREGIAIENLTDEKLVQVFDCLKKGKIAKEAIPILLRELILKPAKVDILIEKMGLKALSTAQINEIVVKAIQENKELLKSPKGKDILLGLIMQKVRGKADVKTIMNILEKEAKKST